MQITGMQDELGIGKNLPYLGWECWQRLRNATNFCPSAKSIAGVSSRIASARAS
jgi:hypothetical protein